MVFYTDMLSPIPSYNWYFEKCSSYDYLICCNMWVKDLVRVSFIWNVNIVNGVFAWVNRQSTTAQGEYENDLRADKHTHTCSEHTNKYVRLHLYYSLGDREDLSEQHIQFIHAIRIKISNIVQAPNSTWFSISTSSLDWYEIRLSSQWMP